MIVFKNRILVSPTQKELWGGFACFAAYLIGIPLLLSVCFPYFSGEGVSVQFHYNVTVSVCNFLMVLIVFRKFLYRSQLPFLLLALTCLFGFLGTHALESLWWILLSFFQGWLPETPTNMNQASLELLLDSYRGHMLVITVVLGPFVEEILFRGVIFAPLCKKSPLLAYVLSMTAFAGLHILSFIGVQHWAVLLFSFLQYLPAGFVLCWSYQRSRSIWAPIVLHGLLNLYSSVMTSF